MGCKRADRCGGEIEKAMMSEGFAGPLGNGLPCGFRKRITMDAMGCRLRTIMKARAKAATAADNRVGKMKRRALPAAGGSEGVGEHVRTRSHRPGSRRWNCGLQAARTERRKPVFFCRTALGSASAS